jgi:hypothetical protein
MNDYLMAKPESLGPETRSPMRCADRQRVQHSMGCGMYRRQM